jgi:hypothetical protein
MDIKDSTQGKKDQDYSPGNELISIQVINMGMYGAAP